VRSTAATPTLHPERAAKGSMRLRLKKLPHQSTPHQIRLLQQYRPKAALASVAPEPALIVAERKKRLEFLDGQTIANRRSWIWTDETVRFLVSVPNPGCDCVIKRMWSIDRVMHH
jgi:hypothetical protein